MYTVKTANVYGASVITSHLLSRFTLQNHSPTLGITFFFFLNNDLSLRDIKQVPRVNGDIKMKSICLSPIGSIAFSYIQNILKSHISFRVR